MAVTRRAFGEDVRAAEDAAPPRRRGLFGLFAAPQKGPARGSARIDPETPLASLFTVGARSDHSAADEGDGPGHFSLNFSLRQSAHDIQKGRALLAGRARALAAAIEQRRGGELTLIAHFCRLLIGLFWLYLGLRLDREALAATALSLGGVWGMPIETAVAVSRLFLALAAFGVLAAFMGGWLVMGAGHADNQALRRKSAALGAEAAGIARAFDEGLGRLRRQMDERLRRPEDAVEDLSRMHLVALEAALFFQEIAFLAEERRADAAAHFRDYLKRHAGGAGAGGFLALFLPFLIGGMWGYIFGFIRGVSLAPGAALPVPEPSGLPSWAIVASIGLALVYALIGRFFDFFRAPLTVVAAARARDEALDSLRAAFVAGDAPRIGEVIRRIEDAFAVYKARLSGSAAGAGAQTAPQAAADSQGGEPEWRKIAEPPRFEAQSFHAAPPSFRADAPAKDGRRNLMFGGARNAAPKQSARGREKPPWLND